MIPAPVLFAQKLILEVKILQFLVDIYLGEKL